jgi:hypothetical protein
MSNCQWHHAQIGKVYPRDGERRRAEARTPQSITSKSDMLTAGRSSSKLTYVS